MKFLHRLQPDDPQSWALWPVLESRARKFCDRYAGETPPDALIAFLRKLFVESPAILGAWLFLGEDGQAFGHYLSWVDVYWGQPYIMVHQCEVDSKRTAGELTQQVGTAVHYWAAYLNSLYEASGSPLRIQTVRWMADRPDAWIRYLHVVPTRQLTTISLPISQIGAASRAAVNGRTAPPLTGGQQCVGAAKEGA